MSARFLASSYIRRHELPALLAHGVRLAPILVGSCLYEHARELTRVQWLHDPGREGALNLAERVGGAGPADHAGVQEADLNLLPGNRGPPDPRVIGRVPASSRSGVEQVPIAAEPGPLYGVPAAPPGYVAREELAALIEAVTAVSPARSG